MIICPALKVEPTPNYNPLKPWEGRPGGQGAVSWGSCIKCRFNKGYNEKVYTIKCGYDPDNIVTLESIPL